MVWLPDGEKILMMRLCVLTQLTNVTDGQTDRHHMTTKAAFPWHRAAKTTLLFQRQNYALLNTRHSGHNP